jgi:hypothetical protein
VVWQGKRPTRLPEALWLSFVITLHLRSYVAFELCILTKLLCCKSSHGSTLTYRCPPNMLSSLNRLQLPQQQPHSHKQQPRSAG